MFPIAAPSSLGERRGEARYAEHASACTKDYFTAETQRTQSSTYIDRAYYSSIEVIHLNLCALRVSAVKI